MMHKKEIQDWFKDIKEIYDENVNNTDMPEGDFNVLEAEYQMLEAILK
jgi:hypothetical protein